MDYTQLAQAKAEKKYPYNYHSSELPMQAAQRQAYIDALNDVKGLYDALDSIVRVGTTCVNSNLQLSKEGKIAARIIEQFEKI